MDGGEQAHPHPHQGPARPGLHRPCPHPLLQVVRCSVRHQALARRVVEESARVGLIPLSSHDPPPPLPHPPPQLDVLHPPTVTLERSPPGEEAEVGAEVTLACRSPPILTT